MFCRRRSVRGVQVQVFFRFPDKEGTMKFSIRRRGLRYRRLSGNVE